MTARIVISCDGTFDNGRMPCRGALPITDEKKMAGVYAARHGWTQTDDYRDLCPAHARIHQEGQQ